MVLAVFSKEKNNFDPDGLLLEECLQKRTDRYRDYSTNLLGVFKEEDLFVKWVQEGPNYNHFVESDWVEGTVEKLKVPALNIDFVFDESRGSFFWKISDIHQKSLPFNYKGEDKVVTCKVIHSPVKGNFWHCSIRLFLEGKDSNFPESNIDKKLMQAMVLIVKPYLRNKAKPIPGAFHVPEIDFYSHSL